MLYDRMLIEMPIKAREEYADGFFREILGASDEYMASIFAEFDQALKGTPYKVVVIGNGRMAFEHESGHVVTSNPNTVRKRPVVFPTRSQPVSRWHHMDYSPARHAMQGERT
ncbi:hypothetical protein B5E41_30325 [Rhizobium esperanzae]|uniref:Uncharacterized protein n=1 Tax=Rhizobium esperanzae TaxID=1967781 RepID=A0A246DKI8_9HYPH|nr:hypothetical protein [Rhizobium esperanzae]OWO89541.1 hypothetical protein B5E41_30325 [Rhizobium esperanzae]